MPRTMCILSPPEWRQPESGQAITLNLRTITPMFGGGYEPREVDPLCIIRPATIRGHLRFWWRATAGAKYTTPQALFKAEEALWGSVDNPGRVAFAVSVTANGESKRCARFEKDRKNPEKYRSLPTFEPNWPPYALQAFQGELADEGKWIAREPEFARIGCKFTLSLRPLDGILPNEVIRAVAAWIAFGGIGARTRRGCGSLACDNLPQAEPLPASNQHPDELALLPGANAVRGAQVSDPN